MRLTRVHVGAPLARAKTLAIEGSTASHIVRVLRLKPGDPLILFDGSGGEHRARIEQLGKDTVTVSVLEHHAIERESPLPLTLAQGVSRGERMDWVIQKATELGVWCIVPLLTERSVVRLDAGQADKKLQHWRAVSIAACEQCGRNRIPEIAAPLALRDFLGRCEPGATHLMLSPSGALRVTDLPGIGTGLTVLIGPEGGLSGPEEDAALTAGFAAVRLGPRILRTETAAIAALTVLQREFGDL